MSLKMCPWKRRDFLPSMRRYIPPPEALEAAQDRLSEKNLFRKLGITTTAIAEVDRRERDRRSGEKIGLAGSTEDATDGI